MSANFRFCALELSPHFNAAKKAYHWWFRTLAGEVGVYSINHVDRDEVWYRTATRVFRQRLDAIGPGEPPP